MRLVLRFLMAVAAVATVGGLSAFRAADDDEKPKHTIKEVMKAAHKEGLLKKVAGGKADDNEKKELLSFYESLAKNKPPKGDEKEWKKRTGEMVKAAKAVVEDKEDAQKKLGKLVNCKACHEMHK